MPWPWPWLEVSPVTSGAGRRESESGRKRALPYFMPGLRRFRASANSLITCGLGPAVELVLSTARVLSQFLLSAARRPSVPVTFGPASAASPSAIQRGDFSMPRVPAVPPCCAGHPFSPSDRRLRASPRATRSAIELAGLVCSAGPGAGTSMRSCAHLSC